METLNNQIVKEPKESLTKISAYSCFLERPAKKVHLAYWVFWILAFSILLIIMVNTSNSMYGLQLEFVLPTLVLGGAAWLSIAIIWSTKEFAEFADNLGEITVSPQKTRDWFDDYIKKIYSTKELVISGFIGVIILVPVVGFYSQWLTSANNWYYSVFRFIKIPDIVIQFSSD
jgi:hypothetical protein